MADDLEQQEVAEETQQTKLGAEQAKALNAVTDNVSAVLGCSYSMLALNAIENKPRACMQVPEKQLDENKVKQAMAALARSQKADKEAQLKRERELAAVKVAAADIDVIATEAEIDRKLAERRLREYGGNLLDALKSFL